MFVGILSLPIFFFGLNLPPQTGSFGLVLIIIGMGIMFFSVLKPLTDEDFTKEELQRMGKL